MARLSEFRTALRRITAPCREDMHEPDEQGLRCRVIGDHLDNAFGNGIDSDAVKCGYQEFVVVLERDGFREAFNLADLIAEARRAP